MITIKITIPPVFKNSKFYTTALGPVISFNLLCNYRRATSQWLLQTRRPRLGELKRLHPRRSSPGLPHQSHGPGTTREFFKKTHIYTFVVEYYSAIKKMNFFATCANVVDPEGVMLNEKVRQRQVHSTRFHSYVEYDRPTTQKSQMQKPEGKEGGGAGGRKVEGLQWFVTGPTVW